MPCRRHRTRHPTPSQYTDTGPTCRCAIQWCGTPHCNTQLPILMSGGGGLIGKSFPDIPQTPANAQLDALMVVNSRKLSRKYHTNRVLNRGPVVCESITLSARPQRLTDFNAILCWSDRECNFRPRNFSPADGAIMLHNYDQTALLFGVIIFPVLERELCKGAVREKTKHVV